MQSRLVIIIANYLGWLPVYRAQPILDFLNRGATWRSWFLSSVSVYGMTKGAIAQLTKVMAVEWAKDNIQVNCVTPGFMAMQLSKSVWDDPYKANWLRTRIPQHRPAPPEELVGIVLLLSS